MTEFILLFTTDSVEQSTGLEYILGMPRSLGTDI